MVPGKIILKPSYKRGKNMKKIIYSILMCIGLFFLLYFNLPENNKTAQIVFTTDSKYHKYLQVALKSAIVNKNPDSIYNITILCVDLSDKEIDELKHMEENNVTINPINVSLNDISHFGNYKICYHVSKADLFKFMMPNILKDYDKVLYLDSDIIVRGDLMSLYNKNIKLNYLAAVRRCTFETITYDINIFGHDITYYPPYVRYVYNCGIMLLNLKKMRKNDITKKLIIAKENDKERVLMTQTAFNKVIPDIIVKKLNPIYNTVSRWNNNDFEYLNFKRTYFPYLIFVSSIPEMEKKAIIIHFAGSVKPWVDDKIRFGEEWWKYAHMVDKNWKIEQ